MSRIMGPTKYKESNRMRVQFSELIVGVVVVIAAIAAIRYYFFVYKVSPGYTLGQFFKAINHGVVTEQYEFIDASDKQNFFTTTKEYEEKIKLSRGYTARIANIDFDEAVIDPKKTNFATINVAITVRGSSQGKELYQSSSETVKDMYALRKDEQGKWKVVLSKSKMALPQKVTPSPPGDPM